MRFKWRALLSLVLCGCSFFLCLPSVPLYAQPAPGPAPEFSLTYPELFEKAGNFDLALHEYKRLKFYASYTGTELSPLILYGMARCFEGLGQYGSAYEMLQQFLASEPLYTDELCLFEIRIIQKAQYPGLSKIRLLRLAQSLSADSPVFTSVLMANIESAASSGSWDSVLDFSARLAAAGFLSAADLEKITGEIDLFNKRKPRSAKAAAVFSAVLPGSGQLYAGFPLDAARSFAVNAAVIGGSAAAAVSGEWPAAVLIGLPLALKFYTSGIENASAAAFLRNQTEQRKTAGRIRALIHGADSFPSKKP